MSDEKQAPIIFDYVLVICEGCGAENEQAIDPPIIGAEQVTEWLKTKLVRCACGAGTCKVAMRMVEPH